MKMLYEYAVSGFQTIEEILVISIWLVIQVFGFILILFMLCGVFIMIYEWVKNKIKWIRKRDQE